MGKIGKIIVAAVGVGLAVIPGAQGFAAGLLSGVGVGSGVTTFGYFAAQAVRAYGLLSAVSLAAGLFAPGVPKPAGSLSQHREPTPPRIYIMGGRRRTFGAISLVEEV